MNKVILVGNLARDPELSQTNTGISVCRMTLAVSRRFQNAEGEREADFINVVVWRGTGENCHKFLKKGSKCGIIGSLQIRSYDDKEGVKRYSTEVIADEVEFLSTKSGNEGGDYERPASAPAKKVATLEPIDDDTLPF